MVKTTYFCDKCKKEVPKDLILRISISVSSIEALEKLQGLKPTSDNIDWCESCLKIHGIAEAAEQIRKHEGTKISSILSNIRTEIEDEIIHHRRLEH